MTPPNEPVRLALEGSSDGPEVLFVHATGFCKEVWRPVVTGLVEESSTTASVSLDLRGHGDSPTVAAPYRWDTMTDDVILTMGQQEPMVGVGHSCGGAIVARAAALNPGMFSHIVLIEPIILPPPYRRQNIPLARAAQRRRNSFTSRDAAYQRFVSGPMSTWHPEALAAYVDHGFTRNDEGVAIKCEPAVEADVFREGNNHNTWDLVPNIDAPVTIMSGERSGTHTDTFLAALRDRFSDPTMITVPNTGHFLPMERPSVIGRTIADVLAGSGT